MTRARSSAAVAAEEPNSAYMKDGKKLLGDLGRLGPAPVHFCTTRRRAFWVKLSLVLAAIKLALRRTQRFLAVAAVLVGGGCTRAPTPDSDEDPDDGADSEHADAERAATPPLSDSQIEAMVAAHVSTRSYSQVNALRAVAPRARPYLVKVLARPESFEPLPGKPSGILDTPAEKALEILDPLAPAEIVPLLLSRAEDPSHRLRAIVGRHLANTGAAEAVAAVTKLLADPEVHVRTMTMHGIRRALDAGRLSAETRQALFEPLARELMLPASSAEDAPVDLLLDLDPDRALSVVTADEVISPRFPRLASALAALTRRRIRLPGDRLLLIVEATPTGPEDGGASRIHGEALKALALVEHPRAESLIQKDLAEKPNPSMERKIYRASRARITRQKIAAEALGILNGLDRPVDVAVERFDAVGLDGLTQAQRDAYLALCVDGQTGNGGLASYFEYDGDMAKAALAGLQRMGAAEHAKILDSAIRLVGPKGLSASAKTREARLDGLSEADAERLSELEEAWYECLDSLWMRFHLYCLTHKKDFVRGPK